VLGELMQGYRKKAFFLVIICGGMFPNQVKSQNRINFNQSFNTIPLTTLLLLVLKIFWI